MTGQLIFKLNITFQQLKPKDCCYFTVNNDNVNMLDVKGQTQIRL
jgi:hypothetical protein